MKKFLGVLLVLAIIGGAAFILTDEEKRKKVLGMLGL